MTPEQFREWRAYMGYTLREAAEALDLSCGAVQSFEAGARSEGRRVIIPRTVELACAALAVGIRKYWSPQAPVSSDEVRELRLCHAALQGPARPVERAPAVNGRDVDVRLLHLGL